VFVFRCSSVRVGFDGRTIMRRLLLLGATATLFLIVLVPAPVVAGPPADVHIEGLGHHIPSGTGGFVASGPAVDAGLVCDTGEVSDIPIRAAGGGVGINFQLFKEFTCDDASGSFFMKLQVRVDDKRHSFNWVIVGGTGDYEDLRGAGSGIGINPTDTTIDDLYSGKFH
jgi:hypothetical protein